MGDIAEGFLDGTFSEDGEYIDSNNQYGLHRLYRKEYKTGKFKIPKEKFYKMLERQEKELEIQLSDKAKNKLANRAKSVFEAFANNEPMKIKNKGGKYERTKWRYSNV